MSSDNQGSCCGGKNHSPANKSKSGSEIDPVCKMTVDPATAKNTFEHDGKKYYFCCAGCLKKFVAAPEKYL